MASSSRPARPAGAADALFGLLAAVVRRTPRELSLTAISTLATLERSGPRRVTALAAVEGVTQPAMTSMVGKLEGWGYVTRRRDPADGRVTMVVLTTAGEEFLARSRRTGSDTLAALIAGLSAGELSALDAAVPALARLIEVDTAERDPAPPNGRPARPGR